MTLQSMTGFARSDGALAGISWHWELRSVNNRGLDLRLRLPPGFDAIEPKVRERIQKALTRGSVNASLAVTRKADAGEVRVNEAALERVFAIATRIAREHGAETPRVETLLGLKGVLDTTEDDGDDAEKTAGEHAAILASLDEALAALVSARREEGDRLKAVIAAQVHEIARLAHTVETSPARSVDAIRKRLSEQVAKLLDTGQALDPARLHQEAVMLATRADVEEELKRLDGHVTAVRALLSQGGDIGRKLDFLAQELNREANTLTSKAADQEIAHAGLALKVVIDQMREQVQNLA